MDELAFLVEAVRRRPAMYVGDIEDPATVHELLWEAMAKAFDEFLAGRATRIDVTLSEDGSVTVADDGAGLPIHMSGEVPFPQLAVVTLEERGPLNAHLPDAKLARRGTTMGLVCALSSTAVIEIARDGRRVRQHFERGEAKGELEELGPTALHGTTVTFTPDASILPHTEMEFARIDSRLRALALMNPGLHVGLRDERRLQRHHVHPEGLRGFLDEGGELFVCRGISGELDVDVALRWGELSERAEVYRAFWNNAPARPDDRLRFAVARAIVDAALPDWPTARRHHEIVAARLTRDLQAVIHVRTTERPYRQFGQRHPFSDVVCEAVQSVVTEPLVAFLDARPELRADFRERVSDRARKR